MQSKRVAVIKQKIAVLGIWICCGLQTKGNGKPLSILGCAFTPRFKNPASMLCGAAVVDDIAMMESFLDNGVDPNCGDYDQRSALHLAASEGMMRVAEFLIRRGANSNALDRWGNTPMVDVVSGSSELLAKLLKSSGSKLPNGYGTHQLCNSCRNGSIQTTGLLLDAGVNINQGDYDQRTALHVAASEGEVIPYTLQITVNLQQPHKGT